jgi:plasmid stability protein
MKTTPLTIRGCRDGVHQALKAKARANRRSLSKEVLTVLEREAEEPPALKGAEIAKRMRKARKLMTQTEHREFAEDIERGVWLRLNPRSSGAAANCES